MHAPLIKRLNGSKRIDGFTPFIHPMKHCVLLTDTLRIIIDIVEEEEEETSVPSALSSQLSSFVFIYTMRPKRVGGVGGGGMMMMKE